MSEVTRYTLRYGLFTPRNMLEHELFNGHVDVVLAADHDAAIAGKDEVTAEARIALVLDDMHAALCDDQQILSAVRLVISAFHEARLITDEQYRLRTMALASCPGHRGNRTWCAYCGDLPEESENDIEF
jgi:hypothetical protein